MSSLRAENVAHVVLNAVHHEREAEVIAMAGQPRAVTIATNMAGRGTDIVLADSVRQAGGLHVIATEIHTSKRIDRQLVGRAARQGDPGSYRFVVSLEDELFRNNPQLQAKLIRKAAGSGDRLPASWIRYFCSVQKQTERFGERTRRLGFESSKNRLEHAAKAGLDPYLEIEAED